MHLKAVVGISGQQLKSPFKRAQQEARSSDSNDGSSKEGRSNEYNALIRAPMTKANQNKIVSLGSQKRFGVTNFKRQRIDSMEDSNPYTDLLPKNESVLEQISERSSQKELFSPASKQG